MQGASESKRILLSKFLSSFTAVTARALGSTGGKYLKPKRRITQKSLSTPNRRPSSTRNPSPLTVSPSQKLSTVFSVIMASASSLRERGTHCLFRAAYTGDLTPFKSLVNDLRRKGQEGSVEAKLNARDSDGLTALHYAAVGGRTQIVKFLVEEAKIDIDIKDLKAGQTPLHHAILGERFPTAVYLLEQGASPNAPTKKGRTPLHYAAEFGPKKLIELLISKGAEINAMADCGPPLQYAAAKRKNEFVKVLLDHNADPNVISHDEFSPLLSSILAKSIECTRLLLKAGADPNICGSKGRTPLGFAASERETEVIKCLLDAGADPNVTNNLGMTPVEEAALSGSHQDVMILFRVTSPIPTVPEWTVSGLFEHVHSDEAREERKWKSLELFLLSKSNGAEAFNQRDYFRAIQWYTEAIFINPTDAAVLSNRSLCWSRMNEGELALEDAQACIALRPDWPKAYYRAGSAWMILNEFEKAADAFYHGWKMDRKNKEIECAFRGAIEALRNKKRSFPDSNMA